MAKSKNTGRTSKKLPRCNPLSSPEKTRGRGNVKSLEILPISQEKEGCFANSEIGGEDCYELIETLLNIKDRAPLPPAPDTAGPGPKSKLANLIRFAPDRYAEMIARIRSGTSFHVAAEAVGIAERTFYAWAQIGAQDMAQSPCKDSYYSRFFRDVRRAAAQATAKCEETIMNASPAKWLANGPARIFGLHWGASDKQVSNASNTPLLSHDDAIDAPFKVKSEGVVKTENLEIDPVLEYEALKVWEDLGLISINEDMKKAFLMQESNQELKEE